MAVMTKSAFNTAGFTAFLADIKLAHSVFALPFAASALLLNRMFPTIMDAILLLISMISARTFAMGINRYLDRNIDAGCARTKVRAIPAGRVAAASVLLYSSVAGLVFMAAAMLLGPMPGFASPVVLAMLAFYPMLKRYSWFCHWFLGICLGITPMAVCVALESEIPAFSLTLGLAISLWTGGFDILYAMQDVDFDRASGLSSVPARFGVRHALYLSRACFVAVVALLVWTGVLADMHAVYYVGVATIGALLAYEHFLVRDVTPSGHASRMNAAFFNVNACVGLIYLAAASADRWLVA